jgi:hypothetical protein
MNTKTCQDGTGNCLRPIGSGPGNDADYARSIKMCNPHATEAGYENEHRDRGHDAINEKVAAKKRLTKAQAAEAPRTTNCWICNPELNEAAKAYSPREGTSRAGMVINVPIRAAGIEKAMTVEARLSDEVQNGRFSIKTTVAKKTGEVALTAKSAQESFILFWDAQGHFLGGSVSEGDKTRKVRNVAEVLRLAR